MAKHTAKSPTITATNYSLNFPGIGTSWKYSFNVVDTCIAPNSDTLNRDNNE